MILLKLYLFFAIRKCIQIQCAAHTFSPHTYERTYPHTWMTKQCIHESTRSLFCYVHTYSLGWFCDRSKLTCLLVNCHSSPFAWNCMNFGRFFFHDFLEFFPQKLILDWIFCYLKNLIKLFSEKISVIPWLSYYNDFKF